MPFKTPPIVKQNMTFRTFYLKVCLFYTLLIIGITTLTRIHGFTHVGFLSIMLVKVFHATKTISGFTNF
jgi:hypothetical protein